MSCLSVCIAVCMSYLSMCVHNFVLYCGLYMGLWPKYNKPSEEEEEEVIIARARVLPFPSFLSYFLLTLYILVGNNIRGHVLRLLSHPPICFLDEDDL